MLSLTYNADLAEAHFESIKKGLIDYINYIIAQKKVKIDNSIIYIDSQLCNYLADFTSQPELKELILATPQQLQIIAEALRDFMPNFLDSKTDENKILYRIFVDNGYDKIDKRNFLLGHNLDTCIYCNRSYTFSLDEKGEVKPEIDHFYSKAIYPLLGVSYFNLIPSCETCNGFGAKGQSDVLKTGIKNPYLIKDNDFEFDYYIQNLSLLNPISGKTNVGVKIITEIKSHFSVFKLDKLYERHSDHVAELIVKSRMKYSSRYREYLKSYNGLRFSDDEIDRLIIGHYTNVSDLHKRPLSKMYRDIGKKLGLI